MNTDNNQNITNEEQKTFLGLPHHLYHCFLAFMIGSALMLFCVWLDRNHADWLIDQQCYSDYVAAGDPQHAGDACLTAFNILVYFPLLLIAYFSTTAGFIMFGIFSVKFLKERSAPTEVAA